MRYRKMSFHKKGINLLNTWVEWVSFMLLVIGFLVALFIGSAFMSYAVILLFGFMAGRVLYFKKNSFPMYMIGTGFLLGYVLGTRFGKWKIVLFCFFLGMAVSYYLHKKEHGELFEKIMGNKRLKKLGRRQARN